MPRSSARKHPPQRVLEDGRIQKIQFLLRSEPHRIRSVPVWDKLYESDVRFRLAREFITESLAYIRS